MGRARIWAVVEGREFDTPYYEALLTQVTGTQGAEVIMAENISIDGSSAGGKSHVLKLFEFARENNLLSQSNSSGAVDALFLLDRDDDHFKSTLVEDDHVIYTHNADVEAEIIAHSDLTSAVAIAFGLPVRTVTQIDLRDPLSAVASLWQEWIKLRLAASICGWSDTRFAQPSGINTNRYGDVDKNKRDAVCKRVEDNVDDWSLHYAAAESYFDNAVEVGAEGRLVKGKWIPSYIVWLVKAAVEGGSLPTVSDRHLLGVCLARVSFEGEWTADFAARVRRLTAG